MKRLIILLLVISNILLFAETEKEIESKITKATVFLSGAQVTRESTINLTGGKAILTFKGLSPYIDKNSIKARGIGDYTILSVTHRVNYLKNPTQTEEMKEIFNKIDKLNADIEYKQVEKSILVEKTDFLISNKKIISNEKSTTPNDFKLFMDIYSSQMETLQLSKLKKQREIDELSKQVGSLNKQIKVINSQKDLPTSEITVSVSSNINVKGELTLSYYVSNAGWFPSYDIRVEDIGSPAMLNYKANVYQNTGIDWEEVSLTFSNATPSESANIPTLYPYFLDFNNYRSNDIGYSYNPNIREVSGVVVDADTRDPIPYANITIKDKTIGGTTDLDGRFSLAIPEGAKALVVNYIGYDSQEVGISNSYMEIPMNASVLYLEGVVVTAYDAPRISKKEKREQTVPIEIKTIDYKTNFEFSIVTPYSLKSNASSLVIDMKEIELNSSYLYKSIPKISPQAFLIANIVDWEEYSLLDGEVNLYFENTYVGKSVLDLNQLSDTLEVSLGADKNITIKRSKEKDLTAKQFISGNRIENRVWKTSIRNNKSEKILLFVYDQVPISKNEEISVEIDNVSQGRLNAETGEVLWEIELDPKQQSELIIEYTVKYPKKNNIRVE